MKSGSGKSVKGRSRRPKWLAKKVEPDMGVDAFLDEATRFRPLIGAACGKVRPPCRSDARAGARCHGRDRIRSAGQGCRTWSIRARCPRMWWTRIRWTRKYDG